jgi:hypothetical protein
MLAKNASLRETAGRRKEKERTIFCEQKVEKTLLIWAVLVIMPRAQASKKFESPFQNAVTF